MKTKLILGITLLLLGLGLSGFAEELPVPTYANSLIISIEYPATATAEVDYILQNFDFGLYAWPSFSKTHLDPDLDWNGDWTDADNGIQSFKNTVNTLITAAKNKDVKIHIVLCSGLSRGIAVYRDAKEDDVRNCQWFNDNNIASDSQMLDADAMDRYIFGTHSRYARKLRANLEAKSQAALAFLKQRMDQEPDTLLVLSGWGEVELNHNRLNHAQFLQDFYCDFSPFAVLEFRDWIRHTGMYGTSGDYAGQGYTQGGTKYQGTGGLTQFNADFGTSFTSWDLKYFDWDLSDDYDPNNQDQVNDDPGHIAIADYVQGGMMPTSGSDYIAGGFDPPRTMSPGDAFYDLWRLFRETLVTNLVLDMAKWVQDAGIPSDKWYSHQIPADYLFGTNPTFQYKNPRYYSSASPLITADIQPYGSVGATVYDIKYPPEIYPGEFARTSTYVLPALESMATNWAAMEYDAESYPYTVTQSSPGFILDQYLSVYDHQAHVINFFVWKDTSGAHQIKGTNKEPALRDFIAAVRDLARDKNLNKHYSPPKVASLSGVFIAPGTVQITVGEDIWSGQDWDWMDWGDFSRFAVFRSTLSGFTPQPSDFLGTTTDYVYSDSSLSPGVAYYYRVRAVNSQNVTGPFSDEIMVIPSSTPVAVLDVNTRRLFFGAVQGGPSPSAAQVAVINVGTPGTSLNWSASPQDSWIAGTPASGTGNGTVMVSVNPSGLSRGTHTGEIWIEDSSALNSPQVIEVRLEVYAPGADDDPFGTMDTPAAGATVSGNIPVSGWALDDIEVSKVEIKRNSHTSDPPGAIGADGKVFVGKAYFVRGARPDVAAAYPDYPYNDKAGWGCMVLTNFLPNQGNGDFTLYAIATDSSGNTTQLGQKLIHCDNANRVKPFGSIDTPPLGGVISGTQYFNFAWALTPQPKTIPTDGSTIWVYIDGVALGHPTYNQYRADIATLFPGYNNSNGAVGFYPIDTTQYSNGVHTLAWSVTDNQGAVDGMSRYFEIQNSGGSVAAQTRPVIGLGLEEVDSAVLRLRGFREESGSGSRARSYQQASGAQRSGRKAASQAGNVLLYTIEELERIVLRFDVAPGRDLIGWGADESLSLPIGSTLDVKNGKFYWIPGPGFLGEYTLHFAAAEGYARGVPLKVVIRIVPKN
jgi:hypothetical protein